MWWMTHRPSPENERAWQRLGSVEGPGGGPSPMNHRRREVAGSVSARAIGWNSCEVHSGRTQSHRRGLQERGSLWKTWKTKRAEEEVGEWEGVAPE